MKIAIIGSRGIPAAYGGFETFTEKLALGLIKRGHKVTVVNDRPIETNPVVHGVELKFSGYRKHTNPLRYYRDSLSLVKDGYDVILCCGVGGAMFFRLTTTPVVTNVDGLEHLRTKYSPAKRLFVRWLQKMAADKSAFLVADSIYVQKYWQEKLDVPGNQISTITYGTDIPDSKLNLPVDFDVKENEYYLVVARFVPENNLEMILDGFVKSNTSKKLVLIGKSEEAKFMKKLEAKKDPGIYFAGTVYEQRKLQSLRMNSFAYIHGHSVGGTNPSLVEAMGASNACICFDNVFNREVTGDRQQYFNSAEKLSLCIEQIEGNAELHQAMKSDAFLRAREHYNWEKIIDEYEALFRRIVGQ